ncbi:toxin-activating lysine-acyltransferase [Kiloniella sp.]|uniref:toxin-activating lysine-acyltransferase n=1 Tax=Kiloniella sp. TaxID=1938587 RepID=UPI003A8D4A88
MPERNLSETRQDSGPDDLNESATTLNAEPTQPSSHLDAVNETRAKTSSDQDPSQVFGEIVAVMMRSPYYRHCSLFDLEWLVIPAIFSKQYQMIRGKKKELDGETVPIGVALWAHVSDDVDNKLSAQKEAGFPVFRLAPQDWASGDIPWLLAVIAPEETKGRIVENLKTTVFKDEKWKAFPGTTS